MPCKVHAIVPPPEPLLLTLTLHGAFVEAQEADAGELALLEAIKLLAKQNRLRPGHSLTIERL
jgi:hypothetical protein